MRSGARAPYFVANHQRHSCRWQAKTEQVYWPEIPETLPKDQTGAEVANDVGLSMTRLQLTRRKRTWVETGVIVVSRLFLAKTTEWGAG